MSEWTEYLPTKRMFFRNHLQFVMTRSGYTTLHSLFFGRFFLQQQERTLWIRIWSTTPPHADAQKYREFELHLFLHYLNGRLQTWDETIHNCKRYNITNRKLSCLSDTAQIRMTEETESASIDGTRQGFQFLSMHHLCVNLLVLLCPKRKPPWCQDHEIIFRIGKKRDSYNVNATTYLYNSFEN